MEQSPLVLIVEDSPTQALKIGNIVMAYGARVRVAADGLEGLRAADELKPDLIVLDVNLPKMDGFQVCARLRRDSGTSKIPIIMLTAQQNPEGTFIGLEAGANDYILKDVYVEGTLLSALRTYIPLD